MVLVGHNIGRGFGVGAGIKECLRMRAIVWLIGLAAVAGLCSGCAVVAVADAVVTTGAVIVKTGVKATGAVVGAVIPD